MSAGISRPYVSLTQPPWFPSYAPACSNPAAVTPHCPISAAHCLQEWSCHRGCPGSQKPGTSHHPCNWAGSRAGQSPQHVLLIPLMSFPTDELEQVLQDGQKYVRARHNLTEGLSWGPFRGSIQSRASSPGQAEPVRRLTMVSPPTNHRQGTSHPGHRPLCPPKSGTG